MRTFSNQAGSIPVILVIVLAVVLAGAVYGVYRLGVAQKPTSLPLTTPDKKTQEEVTKGGVESPSTAAPEEGLEESQVGMRNEETRFARFGNLLDRGGWILLYEEPGNPAIDVSLKFTPNSQCDLGEGYTVCDTSKFENGMMVTVDGDQSGQEVTVLSMKKL